MKSSNNFVFPVQLRYTENQKKKKKNRTKFNNVSSKKYALSLANANLRTKLCAKYLRCAFSDFDVQQTNKILSTKTWKLRKIAYVMRRLMRFQIENISKRTQRRWFKRPTLESLIVYVCSQGETGGNCLPKILLCLPKNFSCTSFLTKFHAFRA